MKKYILLILLISFIYPRRDCLHQRELDRLGRPYERPDEIQDSTLSPKGHFYIHYDTTETGLTEAGPPDLTDLNLNGVPDYIDEVGAIADSARKVLVEIMGYRRAPFDADSIYDIYIKNYPKGEYGYNYPDEDGSADQNQENGESSFLCIDNDFIPHSSDVDISPLDIMRITLVHEYFHAIQWGYGSDTNSNAYFYEMSSMWFEDVMIPAGNDYLEYSWIKDLFDHPTRAFNNTGQGYELALFGHYLSSFIDPKGRIDAKQSTIMLEIWSRFSNCTDFYEHSECKNRGAFYAVEDILEENYNTTFIESWVDFISRNLYNGIDESFYYYSDQALIDPILKEIDPQTLEDRDTCVLSLDNKSAAIQSYQLGESGLFGIDHLSTNYVGRFSIISTNDYNDLFMGSDISAAFALRKLKNLEKNLNKRKKNFNKLKTIFNKYSDIIETFDTTQGYETGWLAFPIMVKGKYRNKRTDLQIKFEKSGIQTRTIFTGNITRHPVAKKFKWSIYGNLTNSDKIMQSGILLGCHESIIKEHISYLREKLSEFFK